VTTASILVNNVVFSEP